MKATCLLFTIYILMLSVYPCGDKGTCEDEQRAGIIIIDTNDHNHSQEEQDSCSPLCICSCCSAHIQLNQVIDITFMNLIHNTKVGTLYCQRSTRSNSDSIWQPPKVG